MFAAKGVVTVVSGLVRPGLDSVAVLQVVLPHALVLRAIHMLVDTATIGLIVGPVAVIDVAVDVDEPTLAVGPVLSPLAAVLGSVAPRLLTEPVAEPTLPLAGVHGAGLERIRRPILPSLVRVVDLLGDRLARLLLSEVLRAAELFSLQQRYKPASPVASPERLQFADLLQLGLQEFVVVAVV